MIDIRTESDLKEALRFVGRNAHLATEDVEKASLLCITRAQEFKNIDLEFEARTEYLNVANYRHKPDAVIAMFPWLLKKCDEARDRFDYAEVLWAYRWVISSTKQYASVPKAKLQMLWDDFERRMWDYGAQETTIYEMKFYFYAETGELDLAEEQLRLYRAAPSGGELQSCPRCSPFLMACYLFDRGRYEELLETIDPVMKGLVSCHSVRRYKLHMAMIAMMMLGRWDEAEKYALMSRKELELDIAILFPFSSHLIYYGITEQFEKGRRIFENQFQYTLMSVPDLQRFEFYTGALVFFTRLQRSGRKNVRLSLSENQLLYEPSSMYSVDSIVSLLTEQIGQIVNALDNRNENDHYKQYAETLRLRYDHIQKPVAERP